MMHFITEKNISLAISVLALFNTRAVFRGGYTWIRSLRTRRKAASLQEKKEFLQHLHESDRAYVGWLVKNVIQLLTIFALIPIVIATNLGRTPTDVAFFCIGWTAYFCGIYFLGQYDRLRNFGNIIKSIDEELDRLTQQT